MDVSTIIILVVLAGLALWAVAIYNRLVALKNRFENAFAQIEVQLKRRYDLIPNLVETAKGYLSHERETLEAVTNARNHARGVLEALGGHAPTGSGGAGQVAELAGAEGALASALGRLNIAIEQYPDLKADQTMADLSEELKSTENRVAFARQGYNDQVMAYNTYRQSFPQVVLAGLFGHGDDANLLEFADSEAIQQAPQVSF